MLRGPILLALVLAALGSLVLLVLNDNVDRIDSSSISGGGGFGSAHTHINKYEALRFSKSDSKPNKDRVPPPFYLPTSDKAHHAAGARFLWRPLAETRNGTAGPVPCELQVEGFEGFRSFEERSTRAHRCLRNKSIVFIGDSLTRWVGGA